MRNNLLFSSYVFFKNRTSTFFVGLSWIVGLFIGGALTIEPFNITTAFSSVALLNPSLVQLCLIRIIPFFLIAVCSAFSLSYLSIGIIFSKALLYGYCSSGIIQSFASAGWLILFLLLFSDFIAIVFLLWFSIRNMTRKRNSLKFDLLFCVTIVLVACYIECRAVSPYLIMLLNT